MARAHHLHTDFSPKIYYRPYLLLPEQTTLIDEQIAEAQAQVDAGVHGSTLRRRDSLGRDVRPDVDVKDTDIDVKESRSATASPKEDGPAEEE